MSPNDEDLEEKKLLGSGGYAIARLTEAEKMKVNLGVHHLFLGNMGRLAEDRFLRYYCNKCEMVHDGCPENEPFLRLMLTQSNTDRIKLEFGQKFVEEALMIGLNRLFDTN